MRTRFLLIGLSLLGFVAVVIVRDLIRPPQDQWTARTLITVIDIYQTAISGKVARLGVRCRFKPTCSHYAKASIAEGGAFIGSSKAAVRLLRCGPWTPLGTTDPP